MKANPNYMNQLQSAQSEVDNLISKYYTQTPDGGNTDDLYKIAFNVARRYKVELDDINY